MHDWNDDRVIVKNQQSEVILSFDDGPTSYLPDILSVLKTEKVQGLFFCQSKLVNATQPLKQLVNEGHVIGTHAHSHRILSKLPYDEQFHEIKLSKDKLESFTGETITWFRPPFGLYNEATMMATQRLKLNMVLWQVASWDWMHQKDEELILENVLEHVEPGDIVLLHELPQTLNILSKLIRGIRDKGLTLATPRTAVDLHHHVDPYKKDVDSKTIPTFKTPSNI